MGDLWASVYRLTYKNSTASFLPQSIMVVREPNLSPGYYRIRFNVDVERLRSGSKYFLTIKSISETSDDSEIKKAADVHPKTVKTSKVVQKQKGFFNANYVFSEIDELNNKGYYFDIYFNTLKEKSPKLGKTLVNQYRKKDNAWVLTFRDLLLNNIVPELIKERRLDELAIVSTMLIKLEKWILECIDFLDSGGEINQLEVKQNAEQKIVKLKSMLLAIEIVQTNKEGFYIEQIITSIQKSDSLSDDEKEYVLALPSIFTIYPDIITQDLVVTCELMKQLLRLENVVDKGFFMSIIKTMDVEICSQTSSIKTSTDNPNDIDTSQEHVIKVLLSLSCLEALLLASEICQEDLKARTRKARFLRILSLVAPEEQRPAIIKAGFNATVGLLDDSWIFTWEAAMHIDVTALCNVVIKSVVRDSNINNDVYYLRRQGKTGLVYLDTRGFTIIPYKQCIPELNNNLCNAAIVKILHHMDTLPLRLCSMYEYPVLQSNDEAILQFQNWKSVTKVSCGDIIDAQQKCGEQYKVFSFAGEALDEDGVLPASLLQELLFLIDLQLRFTTDKTEHLSLIGYAYCLCTILPNKRSYYYDFLLKYYATISKFVYDDVRSLNIDLNEYDIQGIFPDLEDKYLLANLINLTYTYDQNTIDELLDWIDDEPDSAIGKIAALLLAFIYVRQINISRSSVWDIRCDIKKLIMQTKNLWFSAEDVVISEADERLKTEATSSMETTDEDIFTIDKVPETDTREALQIDIYDDQTISATGSHLASNLDRGVINFEIPAYARDGILLLFNNEGGLAKIGLQNISETGMNRQTITFNPCILGNHFVVPVECIVGIRFTKGNKVYVKIFQSKKLSFCSFEDISFERQVDIADGSFQPFIMPESVVDKQLEQVLGKAVKVGSLPEEIVKRMESYGVIFRQEEYGTV